MAQITLNSTGVASSGSLVLQSNGTTSAVTVDASQNLGIGLTPSAWASNFKAMEFANGCSFTATVSGVNSLITNNTFNNGTNWIYKTTAAAGYYNQTTGQHQWFNAASGTAGNTITFTQAMTLNASGSLLLGTTTTPSGGSATQVISASNGGLQLHSTSQGGGALLSSAVTSTGLGFYTYTGNVGSESYSERARFDSSGNLLVNQTSQNGAGKVEISYDRATHWAMQLRNSGANAQTTYIEFKNSATNTGRISSSGSTTSYETTSD